MSSGTQGPPRQVSHLPPSLTICAVDDITPQLAADALRRSCLKMRFDRAVLLSSARPATLAAGIEHVAIPALASRDAYSRFILRDLHHHIDTTHVLIVQWDGFVLDGTAWDGAFAAYDYIGAVWDWHTQRRIGNGGFSLRSRKLLKAAAEIAPEQTAGLGEDEMICRVLAARLESEFGIVFAPEALARRFAYERALPDGRTFGFHGFFNLWRHLGDDELLEITAALPVGLVRSREFLEYAACCLAVKKYSAAHAAMRRLLACVGGDGLDAHFHQAGVAPELAKMLLEI